MIFSKAAGGKAGEEVLDKISRTLLTTAVSEDEQVYYNIYFFFLQKYF